MRSKPTPTWESKPPYLLSPKAKLYLDYTHPQTCWLGDGCALCMGIGLPSCMLANVGSLGSGSTKNIASPTVKSQWSDSHNKQVKKWDWERKEQQKKVFASPLSQTRTQIHFIQTSNHWCLWLNWITEWKDVDLNEKIMFSECLCSDNWMMKIFFLLCTLTFTLQPYQTFKSTQYYNWQ